MRMLPYLYQLCFYPVRKWTSCAWFVRTASQDGDYKIMRTFGCCNVYCPHGGALDMGHLDLTLLNIFSHLSQLLPTTLPLGPSIFRCFASRRVRLGGVTQAFYPSIPLQSVGGLMGPFGAPQLHFCGRNGSTDLFRGCTLSTKCICLIVPGLFVVSFTSLAGCLHLYTL